MQAELDDIVLGTEYHDPRTDREKQNFKRCLELVERTEICHDNISEELVRDVHFCLSQGINNLNNTPGKYRYLPSYVFALKGCGYNYQSPYRTCQDIYKGMQEFCLWANRTKIDIVEKAILSHLNIIKIHPFGDFNGRTARILEMLILKSHGLQFNPISVSNYYYTHCQEYYRLCSHAVRSVNPIDFIEFTKKALQAGMK